MSKAVKKKENHHAHVIIPENVWQALKKIGESRKPKVSVTALLIEGAEWLIRNE